MKLSFSTLGCPDWNIGKIADKAAEYGFDGVEIRVNGKQHVDPGIAIDERKAIRKLFEKKNIQICCLAAYSAFNSNKAEELERNRNLLTNCINLAEDLGAPYVRTFIGDCSQEVSENDIVKNAARYLNICGEEAEKKSVKILIETHDSFSLSQKVMKILDLIHNDGVKVLWDIHHPYRSGETPEETFDTYPSKPTHILNN